MFIAFAPRENPKLAVAVIMPEGGFGGYSAAPVARKIFDAYDQEYGLDGIPKKKPVQDPAQTEQNGQVQQNDQTQGNTAGQSEPDWRDQYLSSGR